MQQHGIRNVERDVERAGRHHDEASLSRPILDRLDHGQQMVNVELLERLVEHIDGAWRTERRGEPHELLLTARERGGGAIQQVLNPKLGGRLGRQSLALNLGRASRQEWKRDLSATLSADSVTWTYESKNEDTSSPPSGRGAVPAAGSRTIRPESAPA